MNLLVSFHCINKTTVFPLAVVRPLRFQDGYKTLFSAIRLLWHKPILLQWLIIPLLLTVVLDIILLYGTWKFFSPAVYGWLTTLIHYQATWLSLIVKFIVFGGVFTLTVWTFIFFYLVISGPFQEAMSERVEKIVRDDQSISNPSLTSTILSSWHGIRQALIFFCAGVIIFFIGLIPLVGPVIGWLWNSMLFGYTFFEIPANRRLMPLAHKWQLVRVHWRALFGFSLPLGLFIFVPVIHVIVLPIAVVAGTLLFVQARSKQ